VICVLQYAFCDTRYVVIKTVAVIIQADRNLLRGVADHFGQKRGVRLISRHSTQAAFENLAVAGFDGIIARPRTEEDADMLSASGVPAVLVAGRIDADLPCVELDDAAIGRVAAEFMVKRGFAGYSFIGPRSRSFGRERLKGFQDALTSFGHDCTAFLDGHMLLDPFSTRARDAREKVRASFEQIARPTGVFVADDCLALNVCVLIRECGYSIPADFGVLGVNDMTPQCELAVPPLSSIQRPMREMGQTAARLLDRMMRGERVSNRTRRIASARIVERASTSGIAARDRLVVKAADLMEEVSSQPIGVEQIARMLGVCRRTLERRFRKETGKTVLQALQAIRLRRARILLAHTGRPVQDIAAEVGFGSIDRFMAQFKKDAGMTATQYRRRK